MYLMHIQTRLVYKSTEEKKKQAKRIGLNKSLYRGLRVQLSSGACMKHWAPVPGLQDPQKGQYINHTFQLLCYKLLKSHPQCDSTRR